MDLIPLLRDCARRKDLLQGSRIHATIVDSGLLHSHSCLGNSLLSMYANCGAFGKAHSVFDDLQLQDVVSWNILIGQHAKHGHGEEALLCYEQMRRASGISPTAITFVCTLKACGMMGEACKGQEIHEELEELGMLKKNCIVGNALVDMYAKCGELAQARAIFEQMPIRTVVSWTVLIAAYAEQGYGEDALDCFEEMQLRGLSPDALAFVCGLKACAGAGYAGAGQQLHAAIARQRLSERNSIVGNALIDMYAKCGRISEAEAVFHELSEHDLFSWASLMAGYVQYGHHVDAGRCFDRLQLEGLSANAVTTICILKGTGAVCKGKQIHTRIVGEDLLEEESVGNALINMYMKCGASMEAEMLFSKLPVRDVISWNTLIAGYAQIGDAKKAFDSVDEMAVDRMSPNSVTLTILLNVCNHGGLLQKALMYLGMMNNNYNIIPTLEHHTCMVDLLGRAGDLDKAVELIKNMPFLADHQMWVTLMNVCRKWGHVELGEIAFQHAMSSDDENPAIYVCMSNIYRAAGRYDDAERIEMRIDQVDPM